MITKLPLSARLPVPLSAAGQPDHLRGSIVFHRPLMSSRSLLSARPIVLTGCIIKLNHYLALTTTTVLSAPCATYCLMIKPHPHFIRNDNFGHRYRDIYVKPILLPYAQL